MTAYQRWSGVLNARKKIMKKILVKIWLKNLQWWKQGDGEIGKFILLLRKRVYAYGYIHTWKRLFGRKEFYISLNMGDITDIDYRHGKRVFKYFNNKNLDDYNDLCVHSDTLLLTDVYENLETNVLKYMNLILLIFHQQLE